jgi:glutamate-1-semialdehyde aminotransferase
MSGVEVYLRRCGLLHESGDRFSSFAHNGLVHMKCELQITGKIIGLGFSISVIIGKLDKNN